ncbi:nitronate monooxygenase, partial [candidate division KSB1 bacterium]|nr:nitronate monooxygenase [candidate division KSB1 bacterium]
MHSMPILEIGNLTVPMPIIQGGMGVAVSRSGLASAVANAGGIGVIASVGLDLLDHQIRGRKKGSNVDHLKADILAARQKSDGIIGVNVMMALTDTAQLIEAAIEAGADILFLGAGLPMTLSHNLNADRLRYLTTKIAPIVSSGRAANLIFQYWSKKYNRIPDAVVVEGPRAGGHLGFKKEQIFDPNYALESLVSDVLQAVKPYEHEYSKKVP